MWPFFPPGADADGYERDRDDENFGVGVFDDEPPTRRSIFRHVTARPGTTRDDRTAPGPDSPSPPRSGSRAVPPFKQYGTIDAPVVPPHEPEVTDRG